MTHETVTLCDHVTHTRLKSQESERTTYGHRQRSRHGPGRAPGQPDPAWHTEEGAGGGAGRPAEAALTVTCEGAASGHLLSFTKPGRAQARATACLTRRDLSKPGANTLRWEICLKIQTLAAASVTEGLGATETHRHRHPPAPAGTRRHRPQGSTAGAGPAAASQAPTAPSDGHLRCCRPQLPLSV